MGKGGTSTVDCDEVIEIIDSIRRELDALGQKIATGMTTRPPIPASRAKKEKEAMEIDVDISGVEWQTKDKQPAGPDAHWCWAFSTTRDGGIRRECMELVRAIELYGTVKIGQFEIGLSGKDGNLLNRRKVKK